MVKFLAVLLMVYTFRYLLIGLLESVMMLQISNARKTMFNSKTSPAGLSVSKTSKTFSKCYPRHYEFISKFNDGLKSLSREGLSAPVFYGDLVYKFKKLTGRNDFSFQFRKIITR